MRALASALLFVTGVASATNYFSWGVETNYTQASIYPVQYASNTTRDCTVAHSGSCSMKIVVAGNDGGNQQSGADLIDLQPRAFNIVGGPSVYYRTWMRIMSGFSWGVPQVANVKTSRAVGDAYPRFFTGHMRSDGFYMAECETVGGFPGGGCLTTSGVPNNDYNIRIPYNVAGKADGQWHEYIVRVKPNTTTSSSDAEFQVWVDGASVGTLTGWRLSDSPNPNAWIETWGGWMLYPYFQMNGTVSDGGTIYVDDFSTDDAYNSTISGSTYTVTPSAGAGGTISPNTAQTVNSGSTTQFTVTPNSGYSASVGGTCGGTLAGTTYTTNAIAANCTVAATFSDTEVPTMPTDLDADSPSTSSVLFRWQPSTDNVAVTEYRIQACSGFGCTNFAQIGTSATTSYTHSGLTASANPTIYRYRVVAVDAAGNVSGTPTSIYFNARPTIPAFPGAEGAGAIAIGGRGGAVYRVTSLDGGTGAGTLRACINTAGPRTCVFDVAGNIELTSSVNISLPYITIAGHTAPGDGITISGKNSTAVTLTARTHNVIVRNIRARKGYNAGTASQDGDSANVASVSATGGPVGPIIYDHVSVSWGQDENAEVWALAVRPPRDITYAWSMIYEPLSAHPVNFLTGAYASAVADNVTNIDLHHSLLANSSHRNPMIKVGSFRFVNSLVYNWYDWALGVYGTGQVDIVGNKFKTGPLYMTKPPYYKEYEIHSDPIGDSNTATTGTQSLYIVGNVGPHNADPAADNWGMTRRIDLEVNSGVELGPLSTSYRRVSPLSALPFPITVSDVATAETAVLAGAGASRRLDCSGNWVSMRDSADARIVSEYNAGTGIIPTTEADVGGYPTLAAGTACTDTDGDGMPDTWETANGLNPASAADGPTIHASGYSNLERYLAGNNDLIAPVISAPSPSGTLAKTTTLATLQMTTDESATCRYGDKGSIWSAKTPLSTTGGTSHSSTIAVWAGLVKRVCYLCRDGSGNESSEACATFSVSAKPKRGFQ